MSGPGGLERSTVVTPTKEHTMSEYLYLYRGSNPTATPQEQQESMKRWGDWFKELGAKGNLKSPGQPLDQAGKVVKGTNKSVVDGPFAEAKDIVGGYSLVDAKDLDHAVELARGCPIFKSGGSVEVRPVMQLGM
jgi:hypothetical protein